MTLSLYETDFYAWTVETANHLRSKKLNELDIDHLLEEIEDMGISQKRALQSRLEILLMHLLKWQYQPDYINKSSWKGTIREQRTRISILFENMPSLKNKTQEQAKLVYRLAVMRAAKEIGLNEDKLPTELPYTIEQILDDNFYPGEEE